MERQDFDKVFQNQAAPLNQPKKENPIWEYKYIEKKIGANNLEFTNFLNVLGNDGWELVNYQIEQRSYSCNNKYHACIFKRLKL